MIATDIQGIEKVDVEIRHLEKSKTINLHLRIKTVEDLTYDLTLYWDDESVYGDRTKLKAMVTMFDLIGADIREEAKKIYRTL